ncbi:hypothetical protein BC567DRAFT_213021 [Phyllosticta citribraziliensis]
MTAHHHHHHHTSSLPPPELAHHLAELQRLIEPDNARVIERGPKHFRSAWRPHGCLADEHCRPHLSPAKKHLYARYPAPQARQASFGSHNFHTSSQPMRSTSRGFGSSTVAAFGEAPQSHQRLRGRHVAASWSYTLALSRPTRQVDADTANTLAAALDAQSFQLRQTETALTRDAGVQSRRLCQVLEAVLQQASAEMDRTGQKTDWNLSIPASDRLSQTS